MNNPKYHNNFRDVGEHMQRKEPTAAEHNTAQLINWLSDVKSELKKVGDAMADYRLQQMRQAMEFKDYITKLMSERRDVESMMEMILQHLTSPGQLAQYGGAVMPSEDAIALKVADLLKRPLLIAKAMEAAPAPATSDFIPSNDAAKQEVIPSDVVEEINIPARKRVTYDQRMDEMMLLIMQQQGGEWNTNKLLAAMSAKWPHTTFKKNSVATAFTILMSAGTIFRVDRGMYQAKELARG